MYVLTANIELLVMNIIFISILFGFNLRYWKPKILNSLSVIYIMVFAGCIFEILAFLADGNEKLIWLNYLSNIAYLGSIGVIGASMLEYCNKEFPKPIWKNNKQHLIYMIPVIIELFVLVSAPKSGLIFYVDSQGFYHRADTFILQMIPYGYLIITTAYGIYWFIKSQTTTERHKYLAIAMFAMPPFFLGGIQLMIKANTLDILEASIVMSLIANYAVSQNNRITRDTLTRLPNREVLDTVLVEKMRNQRKDEKDYLYVMMGDLDGFKGINDTYGHLEGDRALILAADSIYAICKKYKATAARFGGDEFVIVLESSSTDLPNIISDEIEKKLLDVSKNEKYTLKMSMGWAEYQSDYAVPEMLRAADKELYQVKRARKLNYGVHE